ncbi:MAG: hypothetical protein ACI89G_001143, partial [Minisyncoccia bacterium]
MMIPPPSLMVENTIWQSWRGSDPQRRCQVFLD